MKAQATQLSQMKTALASLAERVLAVDIRAYESMPPDRLATSLSPVVEALLADACSLVGDVLRAYEAIGSEGERSDTGLPAPHVQFEQAIDAAIDAQAVSSLQVVGDIAFLAHLELRQRAERLERVTSHRNAIAIVEECDSALRRIRKALTSIDFALARAGIGEAAFDFASELEVSLRVRRGCAKLRRRVLTGGDPTAETLYARLRSAGTAIAMLVGWEVYPSLRVRDRLQLRDVQRRILDWLRSDRDTTEGLRLWQDLVSFMRMLSQVNRRQELRAHDARIAREAHARLLSGDGERLDEETVALLAALEGLDEEIDSLLSSPEGDRREGWRLPLERIVQVLGGPEAAR